VPAISAAEDEVAVALKQFGARQPIAEIQAVVWGPMHPAVALQRTSEAVSCGNLKVFAEIGREIARFEEMCPADAKFAGPAIEGFSEGLRSGEPPDGQAYLIQAFRSYYRSFFESDFKRRAELLLLANIGIGYHEQTRL
jgi:hypothetical protein